MLFFFALFMSYLNCTLSFEKTDTGRTTKPICVFCNFRAAMLMHSR